MAAYLLQIGLSQVFAVDGVPGVTADTDTIFLLQVNSTHDGVTDATGHFEPTLDGTVTFANDAELGGWAMIFGDDSANRINVSDDNDGNLISFDSADSTGEKGFTLQIWAYLEPGAFSGGIMALKAGSFAYALDEYTGAQPHIWRFTNSWTTFPSDTVAASGRQYDYYPIGGATFNGRFPIMEGEWVCLSMTYDESLQCYRSWINDGVDQVRYLSRLGDQQVQSDHSKILTFAHGMKNIRIGAVKLSKGPKMLGDMPPLETYMRQNPFQGKLTLVLDHVDPRLALPLTVVVGGETPNSTISSHSTWPFVTEINDHDRHNFDLPLPIYDWQGSVFRYAVKIYSGEGANKRQVYERNVEITNPKPTGGRIGIDSNNVMSIDGTPVFPFMMYKVNRDDYAQLAELGFNMIQPNSNRSKQEQLDAAEAAGVYLTLEGSARSESKLDDVYAYEGDAGLGVWMSYDEPYGDLTRLQDSYNAMKLADRYTPVYICQNNSSRYNETAAACDIFAIDPYPIPNVSLRFVYDMTARAVAAVDNERPVWVILDQYNIGASDKRPTLQELRCMAYEAFIAGASGLGIYSWEEPSGNWTLEDNASDLAILTEFMEEMTGKVTENLLMVPNRLELPVTFSGQSDANALHGAIKVYDGDTYLFIANDSRESQTTTVSAAHLSGTGTVITNWNEPASGDIMFTSGSCSDYTIPACTAALYKFNGEIDEMIPPVPTENHIRYD